jgi:hypothetical protein
VGGEDRERERERESRGEKEKVFISYHSLDPNYKNPSTKYHPENPDKTQTPWNGSQGRREKPPSPPTSISLLL